MCELLQKKNFTFFENINDKLSIDIKLVYKEKDVIEIVNKKEYEKLIEIKNNIDKLEDCKLWDKTKKISNDYELIYLPNKKMKSNSISKYEPLSRSYFKLWEIIHDFNLVNCNTKIKVGALAEGPGGFIEALINYRKKFKLISKEDKIYGITLKSIDKDIPGWNKAFNFLKKNPNVNISYGEDGTGDIYKLKNIKYFSTLFNRDADLVTADGGFDFSTNFNKQEQSSLRIIFCEIITALSIQKKGGSFVCKIYDSYTRVTISFIYLLHTLYDIVYITKPLTSRPANSEKYLVCKGFKGITNELLAKLYIIVGSWSYIDEIDQYIYQIAKFDSIPEYFINNMIKFNTFFYNQQSYSINKTLSYINIFEKNIDYDKTNHYNNIITNQINLAFYWCKRYKCKVNYESDYFLNYNTNIVISNKKKIYNKSFKNKLRNRNNIRNIKTI